MLLAVSNFMNSFIKCYWAFYLFSIVPSKYIELSHFTSDNLPVTVGGTIGACVIVIIGFILALFVVRYVSEKTIMTKFKNV